MPHHLDDLIIDAIIKLLVGLIIALLHRRLAQRPPEPPTLPPAKPRRRLRRFLTYPHARRHEPRPPRALARSLEPRREQERSGAVRKKGY